MQWVAPHSLPQPDSRIQWRVYTTYLAAVNIEALQMQFTFRNNNNNNPPAHITAWEATEQKLNILLEWPYDLAKLQIVYVENKYNPIA